VLPFEYTQYEGYKPLREYTDQSFPFKGAQVHVFCYNIDNDFDQPAMPAGEQDHLTSLLAATLQHAMFQGDRGLHPFNRRRETEFSSAADLVTAYAKRCAPFIERSETARVQHAAAQAFLTVVTEALPSGDIHTATSLLSEVYSTRDGELAVEWMGPELVKATVAVQSVIIQQLCTALSPGNPEEFYFALLDRFPSGTDPLEVHQGVFFVIFRIAMEERVAARGSLQDGLLPRMSTSQVSDLASSVFVLAFLFISADESMAMFVLDSGCEMGISDARLHKLRAKLNNFRYNRLDQSVLHSMKSSFKSLFKGGERDEEKHLLLTDSIRDCDCALAIDPNDIDAMFCKAFALRSLPDVAGPTNRLQEAATLYAQYLEIAEPDDRQRAPVHYHCGLLLLLAAVIANKEEISQSLLRRVRSHYKKGLEAEDARLPFFEPVACQSKGMLGTMLTAYRVSHRT
jgi:hypothetical protein